MDETESNDTFILPSEAIQRPNILRSQDNKKSTGHVQFKNSSKIHYTNSMGMKSGLALLLIIIMPNLTLTLNYVISHNLEFKKILNSFLTNDFLKILKTIWTNDNIDIGFGIRCVVIYSAFQLILMSIVPGTVVYGPRTNKGNVPQYWDNGFRCYIITMSVFAAIAIYLEIYTSYTVGIIYTKFSGILLCLTFFGFIFCLMLYIKGISFPSSTDSGVSGNVIFDYYWGTELYPRIAGFDIKVFTNCRFGMTLWPLLILCFLRHALTIHTNNTGIIVNVLLQMLYLTKFFWWEGGYYNTLDIILDRAGFYICWGCIVFVPGFYTLSTHIMARWSISNSGNLCAATCLLVGLVSLALNYWADYQKQVFREANGTVSIWGRPARYIEAYYTDVTGHVRRSLLLTSGFWGLARHFNYLSELVLSFCWCASAGYVHPLVYSYFVFLLILLLHRVERDDRKCTSKYGDYYVLYKIQVPYKIIPYLY